MGSVAAVSRDQVTSVSRAPAAFSPLHSAVSDVTRADYRRLVEGLFRSRERRLLIAMYGHNYSTKAVRYTPTHSTAVAVGAAGRRDAGARDARIRHAPQGVVSWCGRYHARFHSVCRRRQEHGRGSSGPGLHSRQAATVTALAPRLLITGATLRPIAFRESATILPPRTGSLLPVPVTSFVHCL